MRVLAWTWCSIVDAYPDSLNQDHIQTADGDLYFNGIPTIEEKVQFAIDNGAGGVMIWELGQDCANQNSLLDVISQKMEENNIVLSSDEINLVTGAYPNPVNDMLFFPEVFTGQYRVLGIDGKTYAQGNFSNNSINLSALKSGLYLVELIVGETRQLTRVVKK